MFKFAIIGAGSIAGKFAEAVTLVTDAYVAAVASKSLDRAKGFASANNIEKYYADYEQMLKEEKPDAVYIATTHNFHYDNIMLCLKYNIPVLCEKCMVLTKKQAEEVFRVSKEKNIFVMECMWSRFLPVLKKAKRWIADGEIGDLVSASYCFGFKAEENHRVYNPDIAGGAMYDVGVYCIEELTYLINKPLTDVKSMVIRNKDGIDVTDHLILQFGNCLANAFCSIAADIDTDLYIHGTKGRLYIPKAQDAQKCVIRYNDKSEKVFEKIHQNGFVFQIEEAIKCINGGKIESDIIPHSDTIMCAEIFDKCLN